MSDWFKANHLVLNPRKSHFIIYYRVKKEVPIIDLHVRLGGQLIERRDAVKFLGIEIDESLKFRHHINTLASKLSRYVQIIYKVRENLQLKSLKLLYNALVYSSLTYCVTAWGSSSATLINPLHVSQKYIVRAIMGEARRAHTKELFSALQFLDIPRIYEYMSCLFVHKATRMGMQMPIHFESRATQQRALRSIDPFSLAVPFTPSTHTQNYLRFSGPRMYNNLPVEIRMLENYNSFKINV